jgi:hypothetical protein
MRRPILLAGVLLLGSCVLGATAFRDQVASAGGRAEKAPPTVPVVFTASGVMVGNTVKIDPANNGVSIANTDINGNIKVHEQGTANVAVQGQTELVVQHTFTGPAAISNIDVSKYKEIRVAFNPQGVTCAIASLTITGPAGPLDEMKPCGTTPADRNKTYDVPGQSLELEFSGGLSDQAIVTVYGRTN